MPARSKRRLSWSGAIRTMCWPRSVPAPLAATAARRSISPARFVRRAVRSSRSSMPPLCNAACSIPPNSSMTGLDGPTESEMPTDAISDRCRRGEALANSRNVPAIEVLNRLGLDAGFDVFRGLGLQALSAAPDSLGLGMAIGALPTSLDRLVSAYAALANDGMQRELRWYHGQPEAPPRRVLSVSAARQVGLFLSDPLARLPSFARYGSTEYPFPVAVKTGTSQGYRDAWTVAWSDRFLVGAWVGRGDAGTMSGVGGAESAADLVRAVLLNLHGTIPGDLSDSKLAIPDGYVPAPVCAGPVEIPSDTCGRTLLTYLPRAGAAGAGEPAPELPRADAAVRLSVVTPEAGSQIWRNPESPLAANRLVLRAKSTPRVPQIVWYVDGSPFALTDPDSSVTWPMTAGEHRFQIGLPLRPERSRPVLLTVR